MTMHKDVEEAIDQIDAAVFSGDTFQDKDDRDSLSVTIARWLREMARIEKAILLDDGSEDDEYIDKYDDAEFINIHNYCPTSLQPITARINYQDKVQTVKGARSGHEPMVVLFDNYSGTGAGTIIEWRPRTLPNRNDAHPYTGIENRGLEQ